MLSTFAVPKERLRRSSICSTASAAAAASAASRAAAADDDDDSDDDNDGDKRSGHRGIGLQHGGSRTSTTSTPSESDADFPRPRSRRGSISHHRVSIKGADSASAAAAATSRDFRRSFGGSNNLGAGEPLVFESTNALAAAATKRRNSLVGVTSTAASEAVTANTNVMASLSLSVSVPSSVMPPPAAAAFDSNNRCFSLLATYPQIHGREAVEAGKAIASQGLAAVSSDKIAILLDHGINNNGGINGGSNVSPRRSASVARGRTPESVSPASRLLNRHHRAGASSLSPPRSLRKSPRGNSAPVSSFSSNEGAPGLVTVPVKTITAFSPDDAPHRAVCELVMAGSAFTTHFSREAQSLVKNARYSSLVGPVHQAAPFARIAKAKALGDPSHVNGKTDWAFASKEHFPAFSTPQPFATNEDKEREETAAAEAALRDLVSLWEAPIMAQLERCAHMATVIAQAKGYLAQRVALNASSPSPSLSGLTSLPSSSSASSAAAIASAMSSVAGGAAGGAGAGAFLIDGPINLSSRRAALAAGALHNVLAKAEHKK